MDITTLTLDQLKALAYDLIERQEETARNLQIVNQQIYKLRQEDASEDPKTVEDKGDEDDAL